MREPEEHPCGRETLVPPRESSLPQCLELHMFAASPTFVRAVAITVLTTSCWASANEGTVQPIPDSLRESRRLADFYQKQLVTDGFLILVRKKCRMPPSWKQLGS